MPEMMTIPKEEWANLQRRLKKMATERSYFQLIHTLVNNLSTVSGLENVVESIIETVIDSIGGTNVSIYYLMIGHDIYFVDAYGNKRRFTAINDIEDSLVKSAFETRMFQEYAHSFIDTKLRSPEFTQASSWAFPLIVGPDIIGVLKMDDMLMTADSVYKQLQVFFNYAAYVLKNEILSSSRLKKAYDEIEAANKDLESFTYSVSHDLRAPLRHIESYSRILEEDYAEGLTDEGKEVLDVIVMSVHKMRNLIDDLLKFSRLGRQGLNRSEVDMTVLIEEAFAELRPNDQNIQLKIHPLPTVFVDLRMMHQVWINLLSNAIKYTSHRNMSIIEIGCKHEDKQSTFYIKDNGIGFKMEYVDKLFGVFTRLHGSEDFEGTGVGLAIVQRIIQRHGGRIWAEGKINEGAMFYFTVPTRKHKDTKESTQEAGNRKQETVSRKQ